jgi:hypothetical protein
MAIDPTGESLKEFLAEDPDSPVVATPLVAEQGHDWDMVLLVRYPTRRAFSEMVADPEYQQVTHLRSGGLVEAVLQPTRPLG